jgi:7,8-dihydropterin-6-yl-methyl-4-(beta-D-ribofuranosyl)aminobenzene 5'-phosphate synthase
MSRARHGGTRRFFIGATVSAALLQPWRSSSAAAALAVPTVDSLSLQVIVDNTTFGPFLADEKRPGLAIARSNADAGKPAMTRSPLQAEFGLALLAESHRAQQVRRVIVDFGYSQGVLAHNLELLGIDSRTLDAAVLSHGHLDHYGGFGGLFAKRPAHALPLIVGGEEIFCERLALIGTPPPLMGTLDRAALVKAGFEVKVMPEPALLADHAFTTGVIPLRGFERAAIPTQMRPGVGCMRDKLAPAKRDAELIPDDGEHELATAYDVKDLGLVVIASCSHRGVLNSVRRAQEVSGIQKVHAIVGGFHLVRPRTDDEARRTAAEMAAMNPSYVVPMHCSGETFIAEATRLMPDKVIRPYVGTRLTFSAT